MMTHSPALTYHSADTCRLFLREALAEGLHIDVVFQTMDRPDRLECFYQQSVNEYFALFVGTKFSELQQHSPYIYRIDAEQDDFFEYIFDQPQGWGCIVISQSPFMHVVKHWQYLLEAELHDGKKTHFRFYDGAVASTLLPACTAGELRQLMGPCGLMLVKRDHREAPWIQAVHPAMDTENYAAVAEHWAKERPDALWKMQAHHMMAFEKPMRQAQISNLQQALWQEDASLAMRIDDKHKGVAVFVEQAIREAQDLGITNGADMEEYLLLRFHTDLVPEKAARLHAVMQNRALDFGRRLAQGGQIIKEPIL